MCGLEDPKVYWEFSGLLAKLEKTEEALELCEKVLTFEPQNTEALMLKVNLLLRLKNVGKKKEAIRILRKLVRVTPKDREIRQRLAVELHNQKKYKEAERHFQLLLKESERMKMVLVVILSGITTLFGLCPSVGAQETKDDTFVILMAARNAASGGFIDKAILGISGWRG